MTIDAGRFQKLLDAFKLEQLFNELGWDHAGLPPQEVVANGEPFTLTAIAQKRGVAVLLCSPDEGGNIPPRPTLLKVEKEATKLAHEHLLIFVDAAKSVLTWLWVLRSLGQPTASRTHTWHQGTSGESLRQKLNQIVWSLEEEEAITLTDVITGLRRAFDRDRISKRFYERFKTEHQAFAEFINGIATAADQAWYASLMLNRLMFVYFIQRKGFLDGNSNYLADRMQRVRAEAGEGHFHSFYRQFLRRLFHEGLGQSRGARSRDLSTLIGDVPYLNGGLFAVHELEEANPEIDIPDEAFERLFSFFDAYDWHLDDRPLGDGSQINPDVLGYIFEKYINQKQMGAYYTKEDITEYISKNTVIPHLLEQTRERCKVAFAGEASVWNLLKADPDRYLYPAMKTGVIDVSGTPVPEVALPDFVQTGMKDAKARMFDRRYNLGEAIFHTATGERGTLPTETWREYVERRSRCLAVRERLAGGDVTSTDDLITLNLDIRQFMQDVIDTCTGPELLRGVWQGIVGRVPEKANEKFRHGITILDPTCGSGAFLFAALNVLEPLYEACLDRMEGFVEDARRHSSPNPSSPSPPGTPFSPRSTGGGARGEGKQGEDAMAYRHHELPAEILRFARELRRNQTDAENLIWLLLRDRRLAGFKFRRQHPVAPYILDFYCHEAKLAIELDGGQHDEHRQHDENRDAVLSQQGILVLRFWNNQVFTETEAVLEAIWQALQTKAPLPSPPSPPAPLPLGEGRLPARGFADFQAILDEVARHPSRRYFTYKSIILHNLFGVDIMAEAVEICKLRLFLKLVSQVDAGRDLEPLPDIDFNLRCGNTLVGFATEEEFDKARGRVSGSLFSMSQHDEVKANIADLADAFDFFRAQQTVHGGKVTADDKRRLRDKLNGLSLELDRYLARDYGVNPEATSPLPRGEGSGVRATFAQWQASHQPFHWFAEFYGVMREGGFDVVIGNPPYLEYSRVAGYRVSGFVTERCNNLYAMTVERSLWITQKQGRLGMIIPISMACSGALGPLRDLMWDSSRSLWLSHFSNRPGQLFTGAQNRLTIMLASNSVVKPTSLSTKYHRWNSREGEREALFPTLQYQAIYNGLVWFRRLLPKVGGKEIASVLRKIKSNTTIAASCSRNTENNVYWVRVPGYFCQFFCSPPMATPEKGGPPRLRGEVNAIGFSDETTRSIVHAVLNSSIYYLFFCSYTDTRHVNPGDVAGFPFDVSTFPDVVRVRLSDLSKDISECYQNNTSKWRKSGLLIDSVDSKPCKPILDRVDLLLAEHLLLSHDELDVVINYDIKYRMGGTDEEE